MTEWFMTRNRRSRALRTRSASWAVYGLLLAWIAAHPASGAPAGKRPATTQKQGRITDLTREDEALVRVAQQPEITTPFRPAQEAAEGVDREAARGAAARASNQEPYFGPGQARLQSMAAPAGVTPKPSPKVQAEFAEFVDGLVDPQNTLDLIVDRPRLLVLKKVPSRIQIADEEVAAYTLISNQEVSVIGNKVGSTILNLWFNNEADGTTQVLSYLVRVVPDPEAKDRLDSVYEALTEEINRAFPDSVVKLALVGDKLVVSGQAKDSVEAAQILQIVAANAPGGGTRGTGADPAEIPIGGVNLNLVGTPNSIGELQENGLQNFLLRDIGRNVINLLRVPGEQQVMLRVTVAEVNRTAARSIGVDFSVFNNSGVPVFASLTGNLLPTSVTGSGSSAQLIGGNLPVAIDNGQVILAIQALRNLNLSKSLAEPNLTTINGQPAQFRAGGEFPVPAATQAFGGVGQGVDFVPFGVQLRFVPYITDRDLIRLQIGAAVSTRDPSLGANIGGSSLAGGTSVTGLNSRNFSTTVELREGQTLAVAGLIQNNYGASTNRVPLLGDLPVMGNFFGRNQSSAGEQELVILVTPELVAPINSCDGPSLPGSDIFEPGDCEFYLYGQLEGRRTQDFRSAARTDRARQKSYYDCEEVFIIGPKGHTVNCCGIRPASSQIASARVVAEEVVPAEDSDLPLAPEPAELDDAKSH